MRLKSLPLNKKAFHLNSVIKDVTLDPNEELIIVGYASTESVDRAQDILLASAWSNGGLTNYMKNPILLFNHDYDKPIGRVTDVSVDMNGLKVTASISQGAEEIFLLIKDKVLSTFSVGFLIKDADYNKVTDGLIIKDAELLEISVVSVPCNQDATFSVAKSFDSDDDYQEFKKQFDDDSSQGKGEQLQPSGKIKMDEDEKNLLIENAIAKALKASQDAADAKAAEAKAAEEAQKAMDEKIANAVAKATAAAAATVVTTEAEKIVAELTKRFEDDKTSLSEKIAGLEEALSEKSSEIKALTTSKRIFSDKGGDSASWKKEFKGEIEDAYLLGRITGKGYNTDFAKNLMEKVNAHSSVSVSSADFEQEVSTNVERDIQNELILAPLFREIQMSSASMILPIMPDTGYAEITASAGSTTGTNPNGTLDSRGGSDRGGIALTEIQLQTVKMVAKSYLGNETEEDAIMPILPLLREAMVRQHARGVENLILLGGHADGAYSGVTAAQGLLKYASTNSRDIATGTVGTLPALTAAGLLTLRKNMGKYGLRAADVKYIVSQTAYFELLEDPEFQDFNLVNSDATKLTGEVGKIFGSSVMLCDEFPDAAAGKYYALAVNTRNFVMPRLRGVTVESDYLVEEQHRVLVTTQRLGFKEIIPNAKSVFGFKYPAAS